MANRYVPGAPNPYFPKHKYFGIPVGRNIYPIAQAQLADVGGGEGGRQAIDVEILTADMYRRLGYGNKHLFLDIYPLHRFYMERGAKEFAVCLPKRQNKRYAVHWEVDRKTLAFGTPFREIQIGFELIDSGDTKRSVNQLAQHEQVNILQKILYNDPVMHGLLAMNQLAWASAFPSGDYEEIQLTLSAQCRAKTGVSSWFSKDKFAKLWVTTERMPFVLRAAGRFDELLRGPEREKLAQSIRTISNGGGVA